MRMRLIVVRCPSCCTIFPNYLINGTDFEKIKGKEQEMCVLIFSTVFSATSLVPRKIKTDIIINVHVSSSKVYVILVRY
jgi:hypothetical protein